MYRNIQQDLLTWKNKATRKPLLLTGVRQCGKTYSVDKFARDNFQNYLYVNLESSEKLSAIFDYDFDIARITSELEHFYRTPIIPGKTLLFLDEIQQCPRAITALKYFCENQPQLHVIGAGSLLGVALRREQISFPVGKVNRLQLYPMSFKEFVQAKDQGNLIEVLSEWPLDRPLPELYVVPLEKLLKEFFCVGGMPAAVKAWVNTHDFEEVQTVQEEILRDYAADFGKYAPAGEIEKIRWIWSAVPVQLSKENNKFMFSQVRAGQRAASLEDALLWLCDAGLLQKTELVANPELPLAGFADKTYFKVYLSDIGLLRALSKIAFETIWEESPLYMRFKGALTENYVQNELMSLGKEPYFWRSGNTAEIDFLYESKGEIIPVEVKASDNTQAKSYKLFCQRYAPARGFKLSRKNIGVNLCGATATCSLPLYLTWNIDRYAAVI